MFHDLALEIVEKRRDLRAPPLIRPARARPGKARGSGFASAVEPCRRSESLP
jgi:hypothetical protein